LITPDKQCVELLLNSVTLHGRGKDQTKSTTNLKAAEGIGMTDQVSRQPHASASATQIRIGKLEYLDRYNQESQRRPHSWVQDAKENRVHI
jgi:hypothetical protein